MTQTAFLRRVTCSAGALLITGISTSLFVGPGAGLHAVSEARASTLESKHESKQVSRGRYLVKIAGCNDCHTPGYAQDAGNTPESNWLIGDRLGWQGPWGTTYPLNLRRFVQGMTEEQWLKIARQPARPPMPWFALREMTDEDLAAIYQFTRSLGPAGPDAPAYVPPGGRVDTPVVSMPTPGSPAKVDAQSPK
jgi:mono/diheme cytochrome c family protein